ncbi:hypothetical protein [Rhizobium terrae]|uniref:hypothetical protein n=1 Tax=Rhizobium terrae TaxID=2171756 RepID=UPI000E3CAB62|nr:hypothetical protein [Rhizobium terrae]
MQITRRRFATLSLLSLAGLPTLRPAFAADLEHAVFWRARLPARDLIFFGYARTRATFLPEMTAEGKKLIDATKRVLIDMNPSLTLANTTFRNSELKPVLPTLPPPYREDLAAILTTSPAKDDIEKIPGFAASILLLGEGQQGYSPEEPSIGYALANYAVAAGRDVKTLASDEEIKAAQKPLDAETVNSVGAVAITHLLDLRRRIGPIGAHMDTLYKQRKSGELARLGAEITAKGILTPTDFMDIDRLHALFVERITRLPEGTSAFVIMPVGLMSDPYGIFDDLRSQGAEVTAIG